MASSDEGGAVRQDDPDDSVSALLSFVTRAQALISELLLLSSRVPPEFTDPRYDPVLFDLRYFDFPDDFEERIEGNVELEVLEDHLREKCSFFLQRYFLLAKGIVAYHQQLVKYVNDLQEGAYFQTTLETIMENDNGRLLLSESLALFGCLLLLLEHRMGGTLREKLLVAHIRHERCFDTPYLDSICLLSRIYPYTSGLLPSSTPFASVHPIYPSPVVSSTILVQKPEDLFARFPFPKQVVDAVICCLRDDDLYDRVRHYPDPEYRTMALAPQAGCLYVLLFYSPQVLHNSLVMREIVDRFFRDCWVIPIFIYFLVDLSLSWDAYKMAKASLSSCLSPAFVRDISQVHCSKVKDLMLELDSIHSDVNLTGDYVFNNSQSLLSLVRNCNVSLRWLLLHRSSVDKKLRDIVMSAGATHQVEEETLLLLLLKTSHLEFSVKQFYAELLEGREHQWEDNKCRASECLKELSAYFSEFQALSLKVKDKNLNDWFGILSSQVNSLDYKKAGNVGQKLYRVISALKEVEQFHQIEGNLQIKQHLILIQKCLQDMVKALSLQHNTLAAFSVITDAAYAWGFVGCFTKRLQKKIEQDSSVVLNLHSFFLKLRTSLDLPLRVSQNHSSDLLPVFHYYSLELVGYICEILEIVPVLLFKILNDDAVSIQQSLHLPSRIDRDNLQGHFQLDQQLHLVKAVCKLSIFSQGILVMSRAFLGVVDLDLKIWIEGRIRKELSKRIENKFNQFTLLHNVCLEELEMNMQALITSIRSEMQLMDLFQDLIHVQGQRIWEEELSHFLKHSIHEEYSDYIKRRQDPNIAHILHNDFSKAQTFIGRLLQQILQLTNPSRSMYIEPMIGWFDAGGHELLGLHFFALLESCAGPLGMSSLDSLLFFLIMENIQHTLNGLKNQLNTRCLEELQTLDNALGPARSLPLVGLSSYKQMAKIIDSSWEPWIKCLATIGQLQLLRCLLSLKLKSTFKVKASSVSFAVEGMIASVSFERENKIKDIYHGRTVEEINEKVNTFLHELRSQGMLCGFSSPLRTSYVSLSRYILDTHLGTLTSRMKNVALDFSPLVIGLGTFLRQFHPTYMMQYVADMGQYISTLAETELDPQYNPNKGIVDPSSSETLKAAFWLLYFCKHMEIPKDFLDSCLPPSLLATLET